MRKFIKNKTDDLNNTPSVFSAYADCILLTVCMRGPNANALSTHLPVMTMSTPASRARAMGNALKSSKTRINDKGRKDLSSIRNEHA